MNFKLIIYEMKLLGYRHAITVNWPCMCSCFFTCIFAKTTLVAHQVVNFRNLILMDGYLAAKYE